MISMTDASPRHAPLGFNAFVAIVAALMGLNALAIDIMLPGLPSISAGFGLNDPNQAQTVIIAYMAGFAGGQLAIGLLADRFGRKPVLMVGLAAYAVAAVACIFAPSFELLLLARVIQGVASAAPRVISTAIVRDCYSGRQMAQVISLIMMVFMAVPVMAPSVGQVILFVAPWQAVFGVLAVYAGVMAWLCATKLPETLAPENRREIRIPVIVEAFRSVLTSRLTVGYTLAAGAFMGALFGFVTSAQQILGEVMGLGLWFPLVFSVIAGSIALSSFVNAWLVERWGMRFLSHSAVLIFIAMALILVLTASFITVVPFLILLSLSMLMVGLTFSNFNALAMEQQGHVAGTASSLIGTVTTVIGTIIGFLIGQSFDNSILPLAIGYLSCGILTLVILLITEEGRLFSRAA